MASKAPHFPQEILDLIIDQTQVSFRPQATDNNEVHASQTRENEVVDRALRKYLLVSRSFRRRVLPHIFANLEFLLGDEMHRFDSFCDILESSPFPDWTPEHLGWHINGTSLSLKIYSAILHRSHSFNITSLICRDGVINLLRSLHRHAPNLATLAIHIDAPVLISWSLLDVPFQEAFQALVRLDSMRSLKAISIIHFPVTFLKGTHVECLEILQDRQRAFDIEDTSMIFSPAVPADIDLPDPSLKMLITDHTYPFGAVPDVSPPGSLFSGLKTLKSYTQSRRQVQKTWLILSHTPLLEILFWHATGKWLASLFTHLSLFSYLLSFKTTKGEIEKPPPTFNLGNLSNIQSIILHHDRTIEAPYDANNDQSLDTVLSFLNPSSPLPIMEVLNLTFKFFETGVRTDFFYPAPQFGLSQWEQLDMLLMGPKYPALKRVMISLLVYVWVHREFDFDNKVFLATTIEKLRDQFPRLSSTDKVLFDVRLESKVVER